MYSQIDDGVGVVRTVWSEIASRARQVNSTFSALVDKLSPDDRFPVYLIYLPYGMLKGDTHHSYFRLGSTACFDQ